MYDAPMSDKCRVWLSLWVWVLASMISPEETHAAEGLKAGAARVEITPGTNLSNWITHKPYGEILEPIYTRAVVLEHSGKRIAMVSWELLYPMEGAAARARDAIQKKTGIKAGDIMVTATHNHSAPWSPVYGDPLTQAEQKVLDSFLTDPAYPAWAQKLIDSTAQAVASAVENLKPVTLSISRAYVGDVMFNRRPIKPDGSVQTLTSATEVYALPSGLRYGRVDPTLTLLLLRDEQGRTVASLYHTALHAVVAYPKYDGVCGDWHGPVSAALANELGGESIFLQGCAGDINPVRRGLDARDQISRTIIDRALKAARVTHPLSLTNDFRVASTIVKAPVKESLRAELGREHLPCEIQAITCGELAIVSLPGEPLSALSHEILDRSPFAHTIVLGYSNGLGVQYVGMPGDRARGGYEMGVRSLGADECGRLLVDAAVELLRKPL